MKSFRGGELDGVIGEDWRKNVWRGIWVHLNSGAGNAIFARGTGQCNRLEGPKFLTENITRTRNHQDVNDARQGLVGGNGDDDYNDSNH